MSRDRFALWVAMSVLVVPLLAVLAVLGWFLVRNANEGTAEFLLLFAPGTMLFLLGLVLGMSKWSDPSRRLLAIRVEIVGRILLLLIPDLWFAWGILTGETSAMAWPAVVVLTLFAALQVVVLTSVRMPEQTTGTESP